MHIERTVPPPAGVDLVFTVPSAPHMNAAYNEAHANLPTERDYEFLDSNDSIYTAVYGRDNQLKFRPTEKRGVRFLMCGHTHGGHLALPGGRPIVMPSPMGRLYPWGFHDVNGMELFVSRGVGA